MLSRVSVVCKLILLMVVRYIVSTRAFTFHIDCSHTTRCTSRLLLARVKFNPVSPLQSHTFVCVCVQVFPFDDGFSFNIEREIPSILSRTLCTFFNSPNNSLFLLYPTTSLMICLKFHLMAHFVISLHTCTLTS